MPENSAPVDLGSITTPEARKNPAAFYRALRLEAPVYFDPVARCYVLSRYEDAVFVTSRPDLFSNNNDIMVGRAQSPVAEQVREKFAKSGFTELHTLVTADPPYHSRNRAIVDRIFTPSFVKEFEPRILELVDELIDQFASHGTVDFHQKFAIPLPMYIILDRLGLPREDLPRVRRWSDVALLRADPSLDSEAELVLADEFIEMQNYLHYHLERFRRQPADTLLSRIANAQDQDGVRLTDAEAVSISFQLMVAGNETTTTVLMSVLKRLLEDRRLLSVAKDDPGIIPSIVEETLRMDTPIPVFYRTTLTDVELHGISIAAGSLVAVSYLSANADERQWENASSFQPQRKGMRHHLGFGRGAHYCIGHLLAKAELRIALRRLLQRLPNLQFSPEHERPEFIAHPFAYMLDSMHLTFDPQPVHRKS